MPAPGRRVRAAWRPALIVCAVVAALPSAAPRAFAAATPTPSATAPATASAVRVVVTALPRAPAAGTASFVIGADVANPGTSPVHDLRVHLEVADVLRTRSALAAADLAPPQGRVRGSESTPELSDVAPAGSTHVDITTTAATLGLGRLGVYPLTVKVRGRVGDARRTIDLGTASTFLPWFPDGAPAPSRLSFVLPLVDSPARAPDGALLDDALSAALRPAAGAGSSPGRLAALLATGRTATTGACDTSGGGAAGTSGGAAGTRTGCRADPVPVTWAVDPELLESVTALAGPHTVLQGSDRRAAGGSPDAQHWLADLRSSVGAPTAGGSGPARARDAVLALPYGDPDVVALTRQRTGLADDVDQLSLLGRRTTTDVLGVQPLDGVAWPPAGPLTSAALDASVSGGATSVILDEAALVRADGNGARTPGTRAQLGSASAGRVTGLVIDASLSRLLSASASDPGWQGARVAEQRWIAETAMIAAERPGESRTFLVAPARRGTVEPEVAGQVLLDAGRLPWLCPVALRDVVAGAERCPASVPDTAAADAVSNGELASGDPAHPARSELGAGYLAQVANVRGRGTQLTDEVLAPGSDAAADVKARFLQARARAESSVWRDDAAGGRRVFGLYRDDVASYRGRLKITTSGRQLLTSRTGVIDVSISNALEQPVTVGVQLNDPIQARLSSTDTSLRTIGPSEVVPVRVRVQTRTSGQFVVRATLLDRSGQVFGDPAELIVRSTGYGRLALAITGVGAGVLLVAAGVRIARRALRRTLPADTDGAS